MIKFIVLITAFSQIAALYQNRIYGLEKSIISLTNLPKSTYDDIFFNQIRLINDFQLSEQYTPEIINLTELTNSTINQQFDKYLKYSINWQYITDFHKDINSTILIMKYKYSLINDICISISKLCINIDNICSGNKLNTPINHFDKYISYEQDSLNYMIQRLVNFLFHTYHEINNIQNILLFEFNNGKNFRDNYIKNISKLNLTEDEKLDVITELDSIDNLFMKQFVKIRKWTNNIIKDNLRYITDIIFQLFNVYRYIRYKRIDTCDSEKQNVNSERMLNMTTNF